MQKGVFIIIGLIFGFTLYGQSSITETSIHDLVKNRADEIFDSLVEVRRDFHMYPELSGKEQRTSKKIEEYLLDLGLEVKTGVGGYGVVGILNGGKQGKKIAWRADIDAFSTNFPDIVEFASKSAGVRHICGHDVHTTIALGIANVLSDIKDELNGTVYFLFQPSEESFEGAKLMIKDGLFDIITPDEIYGLHMFPIPTGTISTKPDEVFTYMRRIRVSFKKGVPVDNVKELTTAIARDLSRAKPESKPWELQNLSHPEIGIFSPDNSYQDYLIIRDNFRVTELNDRYLFESVLYETDRLNLDSILIKAEQQILNSEYKDKFIGIEYTSEDPGVDNNKELTESALNLISEVYGGKSIIPDYGQIPFFNDDFSYFQQHVPGVYFLLGGSNSDKGLISMPHSPNFAVDEESIRIGVKYFASLIINRANVINE